MSETYMDQVLEGEALWTDIDDYVARWHEEQPGLELHDFLGMTWDEYALWAEQPRALRLIIAARQRDEPVVELVQRTEEHAVAARGLSDRDVRVVRSWLQETGRLPKT
jgi:hypothetical protein